jgi:hypothetical protein
VGEVQKKVRSMIMCCCTPGFMLFNSRTRAATSAEG